jgi:Uma2 family endonuclease
MLMSTKLHRHLFTINEFHRMGETGILSDQDRVELLEGELIEMTPIGSWHASCVDRLNRLLTIRLGRAAIVRVQNPIVLGGRTQPQPDVAVVRADPTFYAARHPEADDVLLLIEVVDSTASQDRRIKLPVYARHGVAEVWLVDLNRSVVEVHRNPRARAYDEVQAYSRGHRITPLAFPGKAFRVADILG